MHRSSIALMMAFAGGCLLTSATFSGCSQPADRTFTLHQLQTTGKLGEFTVDTSELPKDAIESRTEDRIENRPGSPVTRIELNAKYKIEVVLKLAGERP